MPNIKIYLCAVEAVSEKTGKLGREIFSFQRKEDRDSFFEDCSAKGLDVAISELDMDLDDEYLLKTTDPYIKENKH